MNTTAQMQMRAPATMLEVSGSPNTAVPMNIAVSGSNTPSTEVLVAPILLVDRDRESREIIVGTRASPMKLLHTEKPDRPSSIFPPADILSEKNITEPTPSE